MDSTNLSHPSQVPGKKEMRKQVTDKIEAALPELIVALGEKKFHNRAKKAARLITDGLHKDERVKVAKKAKAAKTTPPKKAIAKKKAKAAKRTE